MKSLLITAIIIIIVLFFPIKIKLYVSFKDNVLSVKFFNKDVLKYPNPNKETKKSKKRPKQKKKTSNDEELKNKYNVAFYKYVINSFLGRYRESLRFKLLITIKIIYDINDAAKTALLYPVLCESIDLFYAVLNIPFKIKSRTADVNPLFKGENFLEFKIDGILICNLVKIIYMLVLVYTSFLGGIKNGKSSNRKSNEVNNGKSKKYD